MNGLDEFVDGFLVGGGLVDWDVLLEWGIVGIVLIVLAGVVVGTGAWEYFWSKGHRFFCLAFSTVPFFKFCVVSIGVSLRS